jgi:hypothetical protein
MTKNELYIRAALGPGAAFAPVRPLPLQRQHTVVQASLLEDVKKRAAAAFLSGLLLVSPALVASPQAALAGPAATRQDAATSSGSRVNKNANSLLRLGLPIDSPEMRKLQAQIEGVGGDLRVKRIGAAKDWPQKARGTIASPKEASKILMAVRPAEVAQGLALLG